MFARVPRSWPISLKDKKTAIKIRKSGSTVSPRPSKKDKGWDTAVGGLQGDWPHAPFYDPKVDTISRQGGSGRWLAADLEFNSVNACTIACLYCIWYVCTNKCINIIIIVIIIITITITIIIIIICIRTYYVHTFACTYQYMYINFCVSTHIHVIVSGVASWIRWTHQAGVLVRAGRALSLSTDRALCLLAGNDPAGQTLTICWTEIY